jgi:predicted exporter
VRPSQNLDFNRRLMAGVRAEAEATRAEMDGGERIDVRFGGNYALLLEETELVRRSLIFNAVVSLLAVLGLYYICYRRVAALLYSSLPLIVGQALTFAVAYFTLDRLSAISVAFTALLMGLGTDFTIVMYARYIEERQAGASLELATERMVGETGIGVFTGVITSAGTFYAMCLSSFRGLWDFGFLMGTGILLCGVAIVTMLPAMITWNEGVRRRKVDALEKLHLQSFGLEHLIPWAARHRQAVLVLLIVLTAAGAWFGRTLGFDDSVQALRSNQTEAAQVQRTVADTFGAALSPMMAIAEGRSVEEALERTAVITERLQPKVEDGTLASFDSILTYLPPLSRQRQVIDTLRRRTDGAFDPARVQATLTDALEHEGFQPQAFEPAIARIRAMLTPDRPITLDEIEREGLGQLVSRYVHREENGTVRVVTYLFPAEMQWRRRPPPGLIEGTERGDTGIVVTGSNVAAQELRHIFVRDALRAVVAGLILVFVLLLLDFRSLRLAAIVMAQVLSAVAMMFGLMKLAGMQINSANAFVATMILGVGIDYGIHVAHRMELAGGGSSPGCWRPGRRWCSPPSPTSPASARWCSATIPPCGASAWWRCSAPPPRSSPRCSWCRRSWPAASRVLEPSLDRHRPGDRGGPDGVPPRLLHRSPDPGRPTPWGSPARARPLRGFHPARRHPGGGLGVPASACCRAVTGLASRPQARRFAAAVAIAFVPPPPSAS